MENINYSNNTNNVTVLGASAHETSEVKIYEHPYSVKFVCLFKTVRPSSVERISQRL